MRLDHLLSREQELARVNAMQTKVGERKEHESAKPLLKSLARQPSKAQAKRIDKIIALKEIDCSLSQMYRFEGS